MDAVSGLDEQQGQLDQSSRVVSELMLNLRQVNPPAQVLTPPPPAQIAPVHWPMMSQASLPERYGGRPIRMLEMYYSLWTVFFRVPRHHYNPESILTDPATHVVCCSRVCHLPSPYSDGLWSSRPGASQQHPTPPTPTGSKLCSWLFNWVPHFSYEKWL